MDWQKKKVLDIDIRVRIKVNLFLEFNVLSYLLQFWQNSKGFKMTSMLLIIYKFEMNDEYILKTR